MPIHRSVTDTANPPVSERPLVQLAFGTRRAYVRQNQLPPRLAPIRSGRAGCATTATTTPTTTHRTSYLSRASYASDSVLFTPSARWRNQPAVNLVGGSMHKPEVDRKSKATAGRQSVDAAQVRIKVKGKSRGTSLGGRITAQGALETFHRKKPKGRYDISYQNRPSGMVGGHEMESQNHRGLFAPKPAPRNADVTRVGKSRGDLIDVTSGPPCPVADHVWRPVVNITRNNTIYLPAITLPEHLGEDGESLDAVAPSRRPDPQGMECLIASGRALAEVATPTPINSPTGDPDEDCDYGVHSATESVDSTRGVSPSSSETFDVMSQEDNQLPIMPSAATRERRLVARVSIGEQIDISLVAAERRPYGNKYSVSEWNKQKVGQLRRGSLKASGGAQNIQNIMNKHAGETRERHIRSKVIAPPNDTGPSRVRSSLINDAKRKQKVVRERESPFPEKELVEMLKKNTTLNGMLDTKAMATDVKSSVGGNSRQIPRSCLGGPRKEYGSDERMYYGSDGRMEYGSDGRMYYGSDGRMEYGSDGRMEYGSDGRMEYGSGRKHGRREEKDIKEDRKNKPTGKEDLVCVPLTYDSPLTPGYHGRPMTNEDERGGCSGLPASVAIETDSPGAGDLCDLLQLSSSAGTGSQEDMLPGVNVTEDEPMIPVDDGVYPVYDRNASPGGVQGGGPSAERRRVSEGPTYPSGGHHIGDQCTEVQMLWDSKASTPALLDPLDLDPSCPVSSTSSSSLAAENDDVTSLTGSPFHRYSLRRRSSSVDSSFSRPGSELLEVPLYAAATAKDRLPSNPGESPAESPVASPVIFTSEEPHGDLQQQVVHRVSGPIEIPVTPCCSPVAADGGGGGEGGGAGEPAHPRGDKAAAPLAPQVSLTTDDGDDFAVWFGRRGSIFIEEKEEQQPVVTQTTTNELGIVSLAVPKTMAL